jgi:flagellum-specific ATP synthase
MAATHLSESPWPSARRATPRAERFPRLGAALRAAERAQLLREEGKVTRVVGLIVEGQGRGSFVGELCYIEPVDASADWIPAEVVGFRDDRILLMPLGAAEGIGMGCRIRRTGHSARAAVGPALLGRVLDGLGRPLDGRPAPRAEASLPLHAAPLNPMARRPITEPLDLGVSVLNGMLTLGKGQRAGIMAGSGVGKSVLLGMLARNARADVSVIALIGERGREVREFIENSLGPEGLQRSVVICATSDQAPLVRMRGAWLATTIAEYFRSQGQDVLLMMDSVTRFGMAQREIGLAVGEPPATRGYTPSVFATLPRLLERAGNDDGPGSLTALYTVLVEGDDMQDPIGDAVRSILDGHIVLSRALAERGHYPAVDVLASVSRVMPAITQPEHQRVALKVRSLLADYREAEDLIHIGAYQEGVDARIDEAIARRPALLETLQQPMTRGVSFQDALAALRQAALGPLL